jgi:hypothetical protein
MSASNIQNLLVSSSVLKPFAPALEPALGAAFSTLLTTGSGGLAAQQAVGAFLATPEGAKAAKAGATELLRVLDGALRQGGSAKAYSQLLARAADPRTHAAVLSAFAKLGKDGEVLGKAANGILKAFSKGGLASALTKALKLSPAALKILGKAANGIPIAGLVLSVVMSGKTLLDPHASSAQKAAAVVSLASGIVGTVLPGSGLVTGVVDIGAGLLADGFDATQRAKA